MNLYENCNLCPNLCSVNRTVSKTGRCGQTDRVRIAWCGLHKGEEPPVSGENGSGMIFFCGCPLHCRYCQNYQISHKDAAGIEVSVETLAQIMLELQNFGAKSLNLVTGTHFIPSIIDALNLAKAKDFSLPVVWNSSGYENVDSLKLIDPYIDLYLIDVKTLDSGVASKFCGLEKYSEVIVPVMRFLKKRHPVTDVENLKGVLVRHLVFPGEFDSTLSFLDWYAENFRECSALSMMVQFVPPLENPGFEKMTDEQYDTLVDRIYDSGIEGFIQERSDNEILWIPDFNKDQPFPEGFAKPLPYFLSLKH